MTAQIIICSRIARNSQAHDSLQSRNIHLGTGNHYCRIRNLSADGLTARYHDVSIGENIEIEIKSGELLHGSVVWARDRHIGVRFRTIIDVEGTLSQGGKTAKATPAAAPLAPMAAMSLTSSNSDRIMSYYSKTQVIPK